jgi:hypothetical protein
MQISSLEPHPAIPGAQLARFEDGTSMTLPPGLSLQNSGATAQNVPMSLDYSPYAEVPPVRQNVSPQMRSLPPESVMSFTPESLMNSAPEPTMSVAPPESDPTRQAPEANPASSEPFPAQKHALTNRDRLLERLDSPLTYSPGTAAFDPEKEAARRKAVPVSQSVAVQGAHEFDPEAVRKYQQMEFEAAKTNAQASVLEAENNANVQLGINGETQRLLAQQKANQQAAEVDYNTRLGALEKEAGDLANQKIDPKRVFNDMSTWKKITLALASGLGGMADPHGEDQVWKMVQSQVEQDVHSQEVALRTKQKGHENALSRLSAQWGSVQDGKAALRVQELEAAKQGILAEAAKVGTEVARQRADGANQFLLAMQAKDLEQMRVASLGKVTKQTQQAMMAPRAATAGGMRYKTDAEQARDQGRIQTLREGDAGLQGKELANLEKRNELSGEVTGKGAEKTHEQVAQYGQRRAALESSKAALDRFIAENGITRDENGNLVPPGDIAGMGRFGKRAPQAFTSQQGINNRAALRQIVMSKVQEAFGAANETQVEMITDQVIGNGTPEHIAAELNQIEHGFSATTRNIEASYPHQVRAQYKANRADSAREEKAKTEAWQPVRFGAK